MRLWKQHTAEFRFNVEQMHAQKLNHLKKKWIPPPIRLPAELRGVDLCPDMSDLPPEFSSQPRLYGGVELDEDEKVALELPVKFGLFRKIDPVQCKIDAEEALNKLRWNKIIENQNKPLTSSIELENENNTAGSSSSVDETNRPPGDTSIEEEEIIGRRFVSKNKVVDMNCLRPTDLPYNTNVMMPWSVVELELDLHRIK